MELTQNPATPLEISQKETSEIAPDINLTSPIDAPLIVHTEDGHRLDWLNHSFMIVGVFLQHPRQYFLEIKHGIQLTEKIWSLLISSLVFLASYGAVLGSGHPLLSLNSAIGVPVLFLGSLATCIPVMYLLDVLTGSQRSLGQTLAVLFTSMNAASTVFFSFAPIMILFRLTGSLMQYFWLNLGILAVASLVGLIYVVQGLIQTAITNDQHPLYAINRRLHILWMFLFFMVIAQMSWALITFFQNVGGFSNLF
ncbi:MAG: hypothetical protein AAF629_29780 [Chloroflexota bacterium]